METRLTIVAALSIVLIGLLLEVAPASAAPAYQQCPSGRNLTGKLLAHLTSCRTARRVTYGYFTHTQPGQHEGHARVRGYKCRSRFRGGKFHIKCHRHVPHTRHYRLTRFVGVAG